MKVEHYYKPDSKTLREEPQVLTRWIDPTIEKLQQENKQLKELCNKYEEEHSNEFKIWKEERHELLDYKSRCEKAIEYIHWRYDNRQDMYITQMKELLEILEDKENINNNAEDIEDLDARITRAEEQYDKQKEEMILGEKE